MCGFHLRGCERSEDFYAESEDDLDVWLSFLQPRTINTEIESDYEIKCQIGKGGFSEVFKAELIGFDEIYAVKSIYKNRLEFEYSTLLAQEIQIMR